LLPKKLFEILVKFICNPIAIFEKLCYNTSIEKPLPAKAGITVCKTQNFARAGKYKRENGGSYEQNL